MNRLQSELRRLYLQPSRAHPESDAQASAPVRASGNVRAMVMALARPPRWEVLSTVWHGVQKELGLPAPAIAVSGTDGLQLWFSLEEPVETARAQAFVERLRSRFLPDVDAGRIDLMLAPAQLVPAYQEQTGNWSAFVAADLAPVFGETPWLDIAPSEDGQAALLSGLGTIAPSVFDAAMAQLGPGADAFDSSAPSATMAEGSSTPTPTRPADADADADPKRFLRKVMNDESVALALRIEAAKALLPHSR